MKNKKHTHRADKKLSRTVGWTGCVAAGPCDGSSHGGVTHHDTCRCGAFRNVESNGKHSKSSGWITADNCDD